MNEEWLPILPSAGCARRGRRGLTTAASIWITAAIGILVGIGFYSAAAMGTVLTLGTLSVFRWIEGRMPTSLYAHHHVVFARTAPMPEATLRRVLADHGFSVANLSYRLDGDGRLFEYRMVLRTRRPGNLERLSNTWLGEPSVVEFRIAPTGD
jgi:putative Mg2+ transporter-C (MgtC) family protein